MMLHRGWLTIVLLVLFVAGCKNATESTANTSSEKTKVEGRSLKDQAADRLRASPDLTLTADELGKEQNKDEKATQEKYKGKVIELTGIVTGISRDIALEPFIDLKVSGEIVQLLLYPTEPRPWDKALPRQRVKLNVMYLVEPGRVTRLLGGPFLEVTGVPNPTVTAEELAKAYAADAEKADQKYGWVTARGLILTGEIAKVEGDKQGLPVVFLKTGTSLSLRCRPDEESARGLAPGMKIKCIGHSFGLGEDKTEIRIVSCLVTDIVK
jgi:hypothetical protein